MSFDQTRNGKAARPPGAQAHHAPDGHALDPNAANALRAPAEPEAPCSSAAAERKRRGSRLQSFGMPGGGQPWRFVIRRISGKSVRLPARAARLRHRASDFPIAFIHRLWERA